MSIIKNHNYIKSLSNFQLRLASSILMISGMGLILWGGIIPFIILFVFLSIGLLWEWITICKLNLLQAMPFMLIIVESTIFATLKNHFHLGLGILFSFISVGILLSWFSWYRRFLWIALGLLYVGLPCAGAIWIVQNFSYGLKIISWIITIVALNDIGAYCIGKWFQGPKLWKRISPSKTWSGFLGGILCALLGGGVFYYFYPTHATIQNFMWISAFGAIIATLGDLFESKIKRIFQIKDSGTMIPGHGGIFDRLDGFLFVIPYCMILLKWFPETLFFFPS